MPLTFSYRSDLVQTGTTEDGEMIVGECYYVVAEDELGYRWAHQATAMIEQPVADLCARIEAHGPTLEHPERWSPIDPRYGSRAYQCLEPGIVAREEEDARYPI